VRFDVAARAGRPEPPDGRVVGPDVEIGVAPGVVGVRDTKDRSRGTLVVTPQRFADLITAIKGELDR
jgi:hypothetical protein